uniref:Uncharacterized protein n=1 Tax=Rhizophora mucronata TaxID=61149 RepID=A0A2P2NAB6_RHIMU
MALCKSPFISRNLETRHNQVRLIKEIEAFKVKSGSLSNLHY